MEKNYSIQVLQKEEQEMAQEMPIKRCVYI